MEEFLKQNENLISPQKIRKSIIIDVLKWASVLLIGAIILLITHPFIPEYIATSKLRLDGLLIIGWMTFCLIRLQKSIIPKINLKSIIYPSLIGGVCVFWEELLYQGIRQFTLEGHSIVERVELYGKNVLLMTALGVIISFFIVFQIKTRKTGVLILLVVGFLIIMTFLKNVFAG